MIISLRQTAQFLFNEWLLHANKLWPGEYVVIFYAVMFRCMNVNEVMFG